MEHVGLRQLQPGVVQRLEDPVNVSPRSAVIYTIRSRCRVTSSTGGQVAPILRIVERDHSSPEDPYAARHRRRHRLPAAAALTPGTHPGLPTPTRDGSRRSRSSRSCRPPGPTAPDPDRAHRVRQGRVFASDMPDDIEDVFAGRLRPVTAHASSQPICPDLAPCHRTDADLRTFDQDEAVRIVARWLHLGWSGRHAVDLVFRRFGRSFCGGGSVPCGLLCAGRSPRVRARARGTSAAAFSAASRATWGRTEV